MFSKRRRSEPQGQLKKTPYPDEKTLQRLLGELLPWWEDVPMEVVREYWVPPDHSADFIGVDLNGNITIVECKRERNPQIHSKVIDQILFYADGLTGMSYQEFDHRFRLRAGSSLAERVAAVVLGQWDVDRFRQRVAANLQAGRFRLIIAVDSIPRELERNVLAVQSQLGNRQLIAVQFRDISGKDKNVRIVPNVFLPPIDQAYFFRELAKLCSTKSVAAAKELINSLSEWASDVRWGRGASASVNFRFDVAGTKPSVLGLYAWPGSKGLLTVNFGFMADARVPADVLRRFAQRLSAIPEFQNLLPALERARYKKFPSIRIDPVLARPGVIETIQAALDEIVS